MLNYTSPARSCIDNFLYFIGLAPYQYDAGAPGTHKRGCVRFTDGGKCERNMKHNIFVAKIKLNYFYNI